MKQYQAPLLPGLFVLHHFIRERTRTFLSTAFRTPRLATLIRFHKSSCLAPFSPIVSLPAKKSSPPPGIRNPERRQRPCYHHPCPRETAKSHGVPGSLWLNTPLQNPEINSGIRVCMQENPRECAILRKVWPRSSEQQKRSYTTVYKGELQRE